MCCEEPTIMDSIIKLIPNILPTLLSVGAIIYIGIMGLINSHRIEQYKVSSFFVEKVLNQLIEFRTKYHKFTSASTEEENLIREVKVDENEKMIKTKENIKKLNTFMKNHFAKFKLFRLGYLDIKYLINKTEYFNPIFGEVWNAGNDIRTHLDMIINGEIRTSKQNNDFERSTQDYLKYNDIIKEELGKEIEARIKELSDQLLGN